MTRMMDRAPSVPSDFDRRTRRGRARKSSRLRTRLHPDLESLEHRIVLSTINWSTSAASTGGNWDTPGNWVGGVVPGASDTAVIKGLTSPGIVSLSSGNSDSVGALTTDSSTTLTVVSGSLTLSTGNSSTLGGPVVIDQGATLSANSGAYVTVQPNVTITDNGALNFASGDIVTLQSQYGSSTPIVVGGTMNAAGTTFNNSGSYNNGTISVNSGGHMLASGSSFNISSISLNNTSILNSGDWTSNTFNLPIFVPYNDVQYLTGNTAFQDININGGTLASGTLNLNVIGTNISSIRYVFPASFTIASGATLNIAASLPVLIQPNVTITDNGALNFASGDIVTLPSLYGSSTPIIVGGTMNAVGTTFNNSGGYNNGTITVNSGGHMLASGSSFNISSISLSNTSILNSGDWTSNTFNLPIFVPYNDVQYLTSNTAFQDININGGTLASGTLNLNVIGTNISSIRYVFPASFTIASGATLNIAASLPVLIQPNVTIADNGTLKFASGDIVTLPSLYGSTTPIIVGGTMNAAGTTFNNSGSYNNGTISVNSGGHMLASGSSFNISSISLNNTSILNSGDWTSNTFNLPIFVPYNDVPLLAGNTLPQSININGETMTGSALILGPLAGNPPSLQFVFAGNFTIAPGATVDVMANTNVAIDPNVSINDNGTLTFTTGDVVTFQSLYGSSSPIVVTGTLSASGTTFNNGGSYNNGSISANSGAQVNITNSLIGIANVYLYSASNDTLEVDVMNTNLNVNSGAAPLAISSNDFSSGTVVAAGDPNATINMTSNYWGSINTTLIAGKITDHTDNSNLPTVNFTPFLTQSTPPGAVTTIVASSTSATFSTKSAQTVTLSASVTSGANKVNEGTVTFIVVSGINIVGNPVSNVSVSSGTATTSFQIPPGTKAGQDTIVAIYNGDANFMGSTDTSHSVAINPAATKTVAKTASTTFSTSAVFVTLSAAVTSTAGTVSEGSVTFTLYTSTGTQVGQPAVGNVSNNTATTQYELPAGTAGGVYTIKANYNGTGDYSISTDSAHKLTVKVATTTTAAVNKSATYSASTQTVLLTASVKSTAGTVNEGSVTFTVLNGTQVVGTATKGNVNNGTASVNYNLPAGLAVGTYKIEAVFGTTADFKTSTNGSKQTLTITAAPALVTLGPPAGSLASSSGQASQITVGGAPDLDFLIGLALEQLGANRGSSTQMAETGRADRISSTSC